jgi:trk system potassium uptake protein TrkH
MDNFATVPAVMKGVDALMMLFGRLEIFGLVQFFFMKWWN